jgi:predicted nucleic acid-binding protein
MRAFFDTNVLVYMFDVDEPTKRAVAQQVFGEETVAGRAVLSTQVLQEFYVAVTRRLARPLPSPEAEQATRHLAALTIVPMDVAMVLAAVARSRRMHFSLWDALIVEAALAGGAARLYTEDLQDGQVIDGIRIENPFR